MSQFLVRIFSFLLDDVAYVADLAIANLYFFKILFQNTFFFLILSVKNDMFVH
jgi:hypothetical protein